MARFLLISLFLISSSSVAFSQAFGRAARVDTTYLNDDYPLPDGSLLGWTEDSSGTVTDGSQVNRNFSDSFEGLDEAGNTQTMTYNSSGMAQADWRILRTRAQGTANNVFYNIQNPPVIGHEQPYDPDGIPSIVSTNAYAQWWDTLVFGGTATNYTARYVFDIDGTNGPWGFSYLKTKIGTGSAEFFQFGWNGYSVTRVVTQPVQIASGGQRAEIELVSAFQPQFKQIPSGSTVSGGSDFSSTVTLVGIEVRDAGGNLVTNVSITGASGTAYQAVPEPATLGVLALGLAALARRRG